LTLFDDFIGFKPVSGEMWGLYDFSSYSLTKNKKMEFKIDYRDIVKVPMKTAIPSTNQNKDKVSKEKTYSYIMQID